MLITVTLLGVETDFKLKLNKRVSKFVKKQTPKLVLFRVSNYLDEKQSLFVCNSFITSQFNYCSLI